MAMAMVMSVLVGLLQAVHDMPMPLVFALSALLTFASYLALVRGARPEGTVRLQ
jgi:DHA1 family bicyclomycin/chloramphenicol resistance-like MFS transporter